MYCDYIFPFLLPVTLIFHSELLLPSYTFNGYTTEEHDISYSNYKHSVAPWRGMEAFPKLRGAQYMFINVNT